MYTSSTSWGKALLLSMDGIEWQQLILDNIAGTVAVWTEILYIVAATDRTIVTSEDGITWTSRPSSTTSDIRDMVWTGRSLVAVAKDGVVLTSPDGITWDYSSPASEGLWRIKWNGDVMVAISFSDGVAITSNDEGQSWDVNRDLIGGQSIVWSGVKFVVWDRYRKYESSNGREWALIGELTGNQHFDSESLLWVGDSYVAFSGDKMFQSLDAVDWPISFPISGRYDDAVWSGDKLYVLGGDALIMGEK